MLREQMSEDPRLDALDRLRMGVHQQQSFWALEELPGEDVGKLSARCEGFSLQVLRREDGRGNEHRQERLSDEGEGDDTDYRSHRESARLQSESANRPKGLEIVHA